MELEEWSQRSDVELVIAALVGNLEAFGELVRRFRPAVRAVVMGIVKSRESVEDADQMRELGQQQSELAKQHAVIRMQKEINETNE